MTNFRWKILSNQTLRQLVIFQLKWLKKLPFHYFLSNSLYNNYVRFFYEMYVLFPFSLLCNCPDEHFTFVHVCLLYLFFKQISSPPRSTRVRTCASLPPLAPLGERQNRGNITQLLPAPTHPRRPENGTLFMLNGLFVYFVPPNVLSRWFCIIKRNGQFSRESLSPPAIHVRTKLHLDLGWVFMWNCSIY